jgi:hypothetical protein
MKKILFLLLLIISLTGATSGYGQTYDSRKVLRVEMKDGNIFVGSLVTEDQNYIYLATGNLGELRIVRSDVRSITQIRELESHGRELWLPNPQSTRHFWSPNGYGLEKGEAYYQNIWIFYNQVSYGVTNNFSIGAGMIPLFLFAGTPTPFWIVPKFSIPVIKDKLNIGTGALIATVLGGDTGFAGLLYGTATVGSRDKNVSFGLAYGFAGDELMNTPVINISTLLRYSRSSYFISENYILPVDDGTAVIISLGGRTIIRNIGLDYSLWIPAGQDIGEFVAIPFLGVTIPLSKKRNF